MITLIRILQYLGLTSKVNNKVNYSDVQIRRKGHVMLHPTQNQIDDYYDALLRKGRIISSWTIMDKRDFYTDGHWPQRPKSVIDTIILTSTNSTSCESDRLYTMHTDPDYQYKYGALPGIGTHFFVTTSGKVEAVSKATNIIPHTKGINTRSLLITLQTSMNDITNTMQAALERILTILCLEYKLNPYKAIKGLREVKTRNLPFLRGEEDPEMLRVSPGLLVLMDVIRIHVAVELQKKLKYSGLYQGEINGKFTKEVAEALQHFDSRAIYRMYKHPKKDMEYQWNTKTN